jgi:hypothetical protein
MRKFLKLAAAWLVLGTQAALAQSGIQCEAADGRRLYVAGASSCPFGLSPAARSAAPISPQKAAFLAKGVQEMSGIQEALIKLDLLKATADGVYGPVTEAAIRAWQKSKGLAETGYLSDEQMVALKTDANPPAVSAPESPQEFQCPARGAIFTYATVVEPVTVVGERVSLGRDGLSCFYFVRSQAESSYVDSQYYAGFWRALTPAEQDFLLQLGPAEMWPLVVGKSLEREVKVGEGTARMRISVERYEVIDTPMGRLPAYVIAITELGGTPPKETASSTFWWSSDLGETIRLISRDSSGAASGWQVVGVTR